MPKRYKNVGQSTLILEEGRIEPGAEFEASLTPEYETWAISIGALALLKDSTAQSETKEESISVEGIRRRFKA